MIPGTREEFVRAFHETPHATQAELAEKLGISPKMVWRRLKEYGMKTDPPRRGPSSIPRDVLVDLLNKYPGISQREIATNLGRCRSTISRALALYGLKTNRTGIDSAQVYTAFEGGATTPYTMSKRLGIEWSTARNWMRKLGLLEGSEERKNIRRRLPACRACGDPADPDETTWGGVGDVHYTCARMEWSRKIGEPNMDDIEQLLAELERCDRLGICFDCKAPIDHEEQVGRCVYAHPCGHRRGQGKARTKAELNECRLEREKEHEQKK